MSRAALLGGALLLAAAGLAATWWALAEPRERRAAPKTAPERAQPAAFRDIAGPAGLHFTYFRGETGQHWITETTGGGVALIDFDGDGWLDMYLVNGCAQPPNSNDSSHTAVLFRNQDSRFADVTGPAGVGHSGYGQGCCVGDFDNDGFDDLYVTGYGEAVLYHNEGDGTFTDVTAQAGCGCARWSTGCAFGDFDRDGDLDLFVANYVDFDPARAPVCGDPQTGARSYCGPNSFGPLPALLFANNGDGTFRDISGEAGINAADGGARPQSKGLGVQVADLDGDGWLDIYVANDQTPNFLFHNEVGQGFREIGMTAGAAVTGDGHPTAAMGIACGDYDGDGWPDLLTTNFYLESVTLYRNLGAAGFRDETAASGLAGPTRSAMGWGTVFLDYDNDGWLDLFAANGHIHNDPSGVLPYAMRPQLFRNAGGSFVAVADEAGPYFGSLWNGRGAALGDLDNDGGSDLVVVHHHQPAALLHNELPARGHFVSLRLVGRRSDRDALGTRIRLTLDDGRRIVRDVNVSGSYLSSSDPRVLVGIGGCRRIRALEVSWSSGAVDCWDDLAADGSFLIREGLAPVSCRSMPAREEP